MTTWTSNELDKLGRADEVQLAPMRRDGTLRNPVTIWVVRLGYDLYVRSWRGRDGSWFRAARARREGHISAGGVEKHVIFAEETDHDINDRVDDAYREKYRRYASYVPPMISPEARSTTLKLLERGTSS